jgi:phage-related baseplate assembly protein
MVTDQGTARPEKTRPEKKPSLRKAIRAGFESLTVTGPSPALEQAYQEAAQAVARQPSREEREAAISQASQAYRDAVEILLTGDVLEGQRALAEARSQRRRARSVFRPS